MRRPYAWTFEYHQQFFARYWTKITACKSLAPKTEINDIFGFVDCVRWHSFKFLNEQQSRRPTVFHEHKETLKVKFNHSKLGDQCLCCVEAIDMNLKQWQKKMISFPLLPRFSLQRWYELRMAHDTVDTSVRSRRLNGVTGAAIDKKEQNKGNGNGVPSLAVMSHSAMESAEVKSTTQSGVHSNTNNNEYQNGRKEETCNETSIGDAQPAARADYRLSLMRGPLLHDNVPFIPQFRWPDLIVQIFLHVGAIYGLLFQFYSIKFYTLIWCKLNLTIERHSWIESKSLNKQHRSAHTIPY